MTIDEVIERVDKWKPNVWDEETKGRIVLQLEAQLRTEFFSQYEEAPPANFAQDWPENRDEELQASGAWEELYLYYLAGRIDFMNGEAEEYNNDMIRHNAAMDNFRRAYHRTHTPRRSGIVQVM